MPRKDWRNHAHEGDVRNGRRYVGLSACEDAKADVFGTVMMTEEERAEMDKRKSGAASPNPEQPIASPVPGAGPEVSAAAASVNEQIRESQPEPGATGPSSTAAPDVHPPPPPERASSHLIVHDGKSTPASGAETPTDGKVDKKGKQRMTPEQKKKLEEIEARRKKEMQER